MTDAGTGNIMKCRNDAEGESRRNDIAGHGMEKRPKTVAISRRMKMLADLVTKGSIAADVGCDHAFLSIYLVQTGKCPGCLAMDVRKGPLSGAREHVAAYGLEEYIETRLSDGLAAYQIGEAQTLVCAGMGGRLMERILTEGGEKTRSFAELILQPQSEIPELRRFLREEGFVILQEDAVIDEGKYYFAIKAAYGMRHPVAEPSGKQLSIPDPGDAQKSGRVLTEQLHDRFGERLLSDRHPVLWQYLSHRLCAVEELLTQLREKNTIKSEARQRELNLEKELLKEALNLF